MLTQGKLTKTQFGSFSELAAEINKADAKRAAGLTKTRAARAANRAKRDGKAVSR